MARILFIDDDAITLEILGKATELLGHQAILIDNGKSALTVAADQRPDLILLDMMLADLGGEEVLERLRRQPATAGIPVVFLTASSPYELKEKMKTTSAEGCISKPVSLSLLMDTIKKYTPN
ncbi:MAG: response regulator [Chloroflexi bacterium]|nr:response regulator [Chloroflexota bacterium]